MKGEALQIITQIEGYQFKLEKDILVRLLTQPEVKDREVCIVSVAGAYRKGKSFLLGFFLRYLHRNYVARNFCNESNWLGEAEEPLEGFSWRSGFDRHTTGLLIWSEVFLYDHPNGKKIAILLLDTQGTFDNKSTLHNCATIFALSTMLSSVQIYNISGNLQENDLQHLQLFIEYGRLALENNQCKPFQKLQILIRDWIFPHDAPHGTEGGRMILERFLHVNNEMHSDLSSLRENISNCFTNIECFLMPHPGEGIEKVDFKGALKDLRDVFKQKMNDFVPLILSADNLILKKINGKSVTAANLVFFFENYTELFESDKLPRPMNILEATAEANHQAAVFTLTEKYNEKMQDLMSGELYIEFEEFEKASDELRDELLQEFRTQPIMGSNRLQPVYLEKLEMAIANAYECYKDVNHSKRATAEANHQTNVYSITDDYSRKMDELTHEKAPYIDPNDFQRMHSELMDTLLNNFAKESNDNEMQQTYHEKLKAQLEKAFEGYNNINNSKLVNIKGKLLIQVSNVIETYNKKMQALTDTNEPFIKPNIFQSKHCELRDILLHEFSTQEKFANEKLHAKYLKQLRNDMEAAFEGYNTINNSKLATIEANFETYVVKLTDEYKRQMLELTHSGAPFKPLEEFLMYHVKIKDKLLEEFLFTMGNNEMHTKYLLKLKTNIETAFEDFRELNKRKLDTIKANLQSIVFELINKYNSKMREFAETDGFISPNQLKNHHEKLKAQLINEFLQQPQMGDEQLKNTILEELKKGLKKLFKDYCDEYERLQEFAERDLLNVVHNCVRHFEHQMRNIYKEQYLEPAELDTKLLTSLQDALNEFDKEPCRVSENIFKKLRAQLEKDIKYLFSDYKNQNSNKLAMLKADLEKAFTNAKQHYNIRMEAVTTKLVSEANLERAHKEISLEIFNMVDMQKPKHAIEEFVKCREKLLQDINVSYKMLKGLNKNKELFLKLKFTAATNAYQQKMDINRNKYMTPENFRRKHEESKSFAINQFKSEQDDEGPIFFYYYQLLVNSCDNSYYRYEQENKDVLVRAEHYYRMIKAQEIANFEEKAENVDLNISLADLNEKYIEAKKSAMDTFDEGANLFGNVEIFKQLRGELVENLDRIANRMKHKIKLIAENKRRREENTCTIL